MIILKDVLYQLGDRKTNNKDPLNYQFDIGNVHYLDFNNDHNLFNFLMFKDSYVQKGDIFFNDIDILHDDNYVINAMKINSQNIIITVCFLLNKTTREEITKNIYKDLKLLKNLDISTPEAEINKVNDILDTLIKYNPLYILYDLNDDINKSNFENIKNKLDDISKDHLLLVLNTKPIEEVEIKSKPQLDDLSLDIGVTSKDDENTTDNVKEEEPINYEDTSINIFSEKKINNPKEEIVRNNNKNNNNNKYQSTLVFDYRLNHKKNIFYILMNYFRYNFSIIAFIIITVSGFTSMLLIGPHYLTINSLSFGIIFVIIGSILFILYLFFLFSCFDFYLDIDTSKNKKKFVISYFTNILSLVIGLGIGTGLFLLIENLDAKLKLVNFDINFIFISLSLVVVGLIIPFMMKSIYKILERIKSKMSNKR